MYLSLATYVYGQATRSHQDFFIVHLKCLRGDECVDLIV